jgi:hypothetical protein
MRARAGLRHLFELVELLRFVEAPRGVLFLGVGPALGARLHSDLDCALQAARLFEAPMTSLFHEPLPAFRMPPHKSGDDVARQDSWWAGHQASPSELALPPSLQHIHTGPDLGRAAPLQPPGDCSKKGELAAQKDCDRSQPMLEAS